MQILIQTKSLIVNKITRRFNIFKVLVKTMVTAFTKILANILAARSNSHRDQCRNV